MANEQYLLKILSGPHQGAEVALGDGELTIGSSPDCDLILSDALVSPEHVKIVVSGGSVKAVPLESPVYIDGNEVPLEPIALQAFQFVSLGTTHFVIGPTEGEWPPISAADVPEFKKMASADDSDAMSGDSDESEESSVSKAEAMAALAEEESKMPGMLGDQKKVFQILGGVGALMLLGLILLLFVFPEPDYEPPTPKDIKEQVTEIIDELGESQNISVYESNNLIVVEGYVRYNQERDSIATSLTNLGTTIDQKVYSQEQIVQDAREVISSRKMSLSVSPLDLGKIKISGYVESDQEWNDVKVEMRRDVRGLKMIDDDVITAQRLIPIIRTALERFNVNEKVELIPEKDALLAKGLIIKEDTENLKKAMEYIQQQIGFPLPVKNQIMVAQADRVYLDTKIESIIIGDEAIVTTTDGQTLFEGGILPGGFVITKITRDGIILKRKDQTITLNIGDQ